MKWYLYIKFIVFFFSPLYVDLFHWNFFFFKFLSKQLYSKENALLWCNFLQFQMKQIFLYFPSTFIIKLIEHTLQ